MTASTRLVHEDCGSGHFTVDGADNDLRKALTICSDGVHRGQSRALSVASRAGVSLKTRDKCGLGQLRLATDGPRPGERQRRRAGELVIHRKRPGARNRASRRRGAPTGYLDLPSSSLFLPFPFPSLPGLRPAPAAPLFFFFSGNTVKTPPLKAVFGWCDRQVRTAAHRQVRTPPCSPCTSAEEQPNVTGAPTPPHPFVPEAAGLMPRPS